MAPERNPYMQVAGQKLGTACAGLILGMGGGILGTGVGVAWQRCAVVRFR